MFNFIKRIFNYWTPMDEEAEVDRAMSESSQASLGLGESQRDSVVANGNSELLESFSVTAETTTTTTTTETAMELDDEASGILSPSQRAVLNSTTDVEAVTPTAASTNVNKAPQRTKKATTSTLTEETPTKRGRGRPKNTGKKQRKNAAAKKATTSTLTDEAPKKRGRPKKEVTLGDDVAPVKKQRKETTVNDKTAKEKHIAMATTVKNEPMDTAPHLEGANLGQLHSSSSGQPLEHVDVSQQAANSNVLQQTNSNVPQQTNGKAPRHRYSNIAPQQKANQHVFRAVKLEEPTWPQMYYRAEAPTQPQVLAIVEEPTQPQVLTIVQEPTQPQAPAKDQEPAQPQAPVKDQEPAQPKATRKRKSRYERELELTRKRPSRSRAHKLGEHQCLICGSTFATLEERDSHAGQDHPADHTWWH